MLIRRWFPPVVWRPSFRITSDIELELATIGANIAASYFDERMSDPIDGV